MEFALTTAHCHSRFDRQGSLRPPPPTAITFQRDGVLCPPHLSFQATREFVSTTAHHHRSIAPNERRRPFHAQHNPSTIISVVSKRNGRLLSPPPFKSLTFCRDAGQRFSATEGGGLTTNPRLSMQRGTFQTPPPLPRIETRDGGFLCPPTSLTHDHQLPPSLLQFDEPPLPLAFRRDGGSVTRFD